MCQSEGTHQIVMSFSPPVVGCLLKQSSLKGGGGDHRHPRTPAGFAPDWDNSVSRAFLLQ